MTDGVSGLSSYYTNIIDSIMTVESQPLQTYQQQQDEMNLHRSAYTALKSKLEALQSAAKALNLSSALNQLTPGRSTSVTPAIANTTIVSATSTSGTIAGTYDLSVTHLAQAERYASVEQTSTDRPLSKSGSIWLGGTGSAGAAIADNTSAVLDGASNSAVMTGQNELGTGAYSVETRTLNGKLQFRLKDGDGNAVAVRDASQDDDSTTTTWQTVAAGAFDTGRGLTINFNGTSGEPATIDYTAAGVKVDIGVSDSLLDIANKINNARQPIGHDLVASVVGKQLVFTAASTGDHHTMIYSMDSALDFGMTLKQEARAATFSLNGISLSRQTNSNLTDVVSGLTLNLAPDAEPTGTDPRRAAIVVKTDHSTTKTAVQSFIDAFNEVQVYIEGQSAITKVDEKTYSRGTLSNDTIFSDLRSTLFDTIINRTTNSGAYKFLSEIGISVDDSLNMSITDSSQLEEALSSRYDDVTQLLSGVMAKVQDSLAGFTGSSGYISSAVKTFDSEAKELASTITDFNLRLSQRRATLINQYGQMQAMLYSLSYQQQTFTSLFNASS